MLEKAHTSPYLRRLGGRGPSAMTQPEHVGASSRSQAPPSSENRTEPETCIRRDSIWRAAVSQGDLARFVSAASSLPLAQRQAAMLRTGSLW